MNEETIPMPVKQYAECIMALQKLEDIRRIAHQGMASGNAIGIVQAIRAITETKEGVQE